MQYFGFDRPSFGIKTFGFGANFDPMTLFAGGKQGVWYDPSDITTLYQDAAGTIPVVNDGDPVALMRDKSGNGNHAKQTESASRPVYKTDGELHWLEFDGVDDSLLVTLMPRKNNMYANVGVLTRSLEDQAIIGGSGNSRVFYASETNDYTFYASDNTTRNVWTSYVNGVVYSTPTKKAVMKPSFFLSKYAVIALSGAAMLDAIFDTVYIGQMGTGIYFYGNMTNIVLAESISAETRNEVTSYVANKSGVIL